MKLLEDSQLTCKPKPHTGDSLCRRQLKVQDRVTEVQEFWLEYKSAAVVGVPPMKQHMQVPH